MANHGPRSTHPADKLEGAATLSIVMDRPTQSDPEFEKRTPLDRLVRSERNDTATAHMSENGYVKHRLLEMDVRVGFPLFNIPSS